MARKRKVRKRTTEQQAAWDKRTQMIRERIAYHEAKAIEEETAGAKQDR